MMRPTYTENEDAPFALATKVHLAVLLAPFLCNGDRGELDASHTRHVSLVNSETDFPLADGRTSPTRT